MSGQIPQYSSVRGSQHKDAVEEVQEFRRESVSEGRPLRPELEVREDSGDWGGGGGGGRGMNY